MKYKVLLTLFCLSLVQSLHAQQRYPELVISGPGTLVSYPFFRMIETKALAEHADKVSFQHWQTPDQMRAMVINGQVHVSAVPSNVAAMFYNRGQQVSLTNVSVWGLLWLVSADKGLKTIKDYQNKKLMIPFRNDMPDLMFRSLTSTMGLSADKHFDLLYAASGMNAMQLLLAGKVDHALLPEPAVSILLLRNKQQGKRPLYRSISLSQSWAELFPKKPVIPQAGVMTTSLLQTDPAVRQAISQAYTDAAIWCQSNVEDCARLANKYLPQIPVNGAVEALKHSPLNSHTALEARSDLEAFFAKIAELDSRKIGGKLPAEGFYGP